MFLQNKITFGHFFQVAVAAWKIIITKGNNFNWVTAFLFKKNKGGVRQHLVKRQNMWDLLDSFISRELLNLQRKKLARRDIKLCSITLMCAINTLALKLILWSIQLLGLFSFSCWFNVEKCANSHVILLVLKVLGADLTLTLPWLAETLRPNRAIINVINVCCALTPWQHLVSAVTKEGQQGNSLAFCAANRC